MSRIAERSHTNPGSWRMRLMQGLSTLLIISGLALIGVGIWIPLQDYLVLQRNVPPLLPPEAAPETDLILPGDDVLSLADNPLPVIGDSSLEDNPSPDPAAQGPQLTDDSPSAVLPIDTPTPLPSPTATSAGLQESPPLELPSPAPLPSPTPLPTPNPFAPAESPPSRIVATAINLDSEVVTVGWSRREINGQTISVWDVADYAAGWHKNSALPGHQGNIVLSGHHNILGEVFRYTVDLEPGDLITLYAGERPYQYRVEDKFIIKDKGEPEEVRKANARWIGPFSDQRLTMITCWPYNNNTHRVIVIAKPYLEAEASQEDLPKGDLR